ncbi:4-aminobutyrate aminotransferase [Acrasis kona]|uniref:4-aminobutyrate aminotransferase n=1 Tax=Acrasis kona TaxID=1008807 RepID=A0AAW2Z3A8_9EUKA
MFIRRASRPLRNLQYVTQKYSKETASHSYVLDQIKDLAPAISHQTNFVTDRAQGSYIYDDANNEKYLDFTCGIGVTNTGHCHPKVVKAIQDQAGKLLHGQVNIVNHAPMGTLIGKLKEKVIFDKKLDTFFFANSGAEAVENAIKMAKHYTKRTNVIVFQGSFHGRTVATMSLTTSKIIYRVGQQPLMSGVHVAPFPYCHHCVCNSKPSHTCGDRIESDCCMDPIKHLKTLFKQQTSPQETAAILIEPVLGEGGYVPAPKKFMQELRSICDEHGIVFIADEVQTGFGRTGKYFAMEHSGVVPDLLVMAKGIASGLPLSGVVGNKKFMEKSPVGSLGGTYGGNALACAAACGTIDAIEEEGMLENATKMGEYLRGRLNEIKKKHPSLVGDVRGEGLMLAVEFKSEDVGYGFSSAVAKNALKHKLLLLTTSIYETLRIIPPINVSKEEVDIAVDILDKCIEEAKADIKL